MTNFFFTGNRGLDRRGGIRYDYLRDADTNRNDVPSLLIGGRPRKPGKAPPWAKVLHTAAGEQPTFKEDKIVGGSIIAPHDDEKRYMIGSDRGEKKVLLVVKTGLDYEDGSTANHKSRLESEGVTLRPHGIVPFDMDTLRILLAESADLSQILNDPSLVPGQSPIHKVGSVQSRGRIIPSINCPEVSNSAWVIGQKGAALKGYITGEVALLRWVAGEFVEKILPDTQRALFEKLLIADRELQRKQAREAAAAAKAAREAELPSNYNGVGISIGSSN